MKIKMAFVRKIIRFFPLVLLFSAFAACQTNTKSIAQTKETPFSSSAGKPKLVAITSGEIKKLLESAVEQTTLTKNYDPAYVVIPYPNGDVPIEKGVCTDVVIRAFRKAGVDLQKEVHEDIAKNFSLYPNKWGLKSSDSNIDHRRVPNLQTFFTRRGKSLAITNRGEDYEPGDVVAWDLDGKGLTHIGLVSNIYNETTKRYLIIHNIGGGTQAEDKVFDWKIIGHYRYF
jgi:uncharacterized protein YijF (DUF1287 family)